MGPDAVSQAIQDILWGGRPTTDSHSKRQALQAGRWGSGGFSTARAPRLLKPHVRTLVGGSPPHPPAPHLISS